MRPRDTPNRELQALREVGRTEIGRRAALCLAALFVLTVGVLSPIQAILDWRSSAPDESFARRLSPALAAFGEGVDAASALLGRGGLRSLVAANDRLLAAIATSDERLEETSVLRSSLLPRLQAWQTRFLELGNEQVYVGHDGWLFYRADVDYVTGPGFLEPRVLARRARGGRQWRAAPTPDPRPALVAFQRELAGRGVQLIVVPTPVKPQVHPDALSRRVGIDDIPLQNPSFDRLVADLTAQGVEVFDTTPILAAGARQGEAQYLATDTHWSPTAVERVAAALAERLREELTDQPPSGYQRRAVAVEGRGDTAKMLELPPSSRLLPPERLRTRRVVTADGQPWRPDDGARVLLLGDSFTNIYSDPTLGFGSGAGLAEQLAFELDRPLARLAMNAGGADGLRAAFRRRLESEPSRFAGLAVVVYQFATRDLAQGDWVSDSAD
jgi:alginate O-acetyltransferase complex protein AlgJ